MIKVSAPGKVHLIGEHAVVYGEPAIIAAIGLRCHVTAEKSDRIIIRNEDLGENSEFDLNEIHAFTEKVTMLWGESKKKNDFSQLFAEIKREPLNHNKMAIGKILEELKIDGGARITIKSDIPVGAGVGSGAAVAVALVKAVGELYGKKLSDEEVNRIAFGIEKFSHGNPSGGDNSACCYGGLIWFQKGEIVSLKDEIPYKLENFFLVQTKERKKSTGELIQRVRNLDANFRDEKIKEIGKLTTQMKASLEKRDFTSIKKIINAVQGNLAGMSVSTKEIDGIVSAIKKIGGAAKLCGAGGGGVVLCYHEDREKLIGSLKRLGYIPLEIELGVEGVKISSQTN